jgi:hypothetical protein
LQCTQLEKLDRDKHLLILSICEFTLQARVLQYTQLEKLGRDKHLLIVPIGKLEEIDVFIWDIFIFHFLFIL